MKPRPKSIPTFEARQFAAEIREVNGQKQAVLLASPYYRTFLNTKTKDGDQITLTVSLKKPKRTIRQNSYYWVYLSSIAEETGNDADDLHDLFKKLFIGTRMVEVMGEMVEKKGSTTTLSRIDFGEYIAKIEEFTGIQSPPAKNYDL